MGFSSFLALVIASLLVGKVLSMNNSSSLPFPAADPTLRRSLGASTGSAAPTIGYADLPGVRHVFRTFHRGSKCAGDPVGYIIRGYSLGTCSSTQLSLLSSSRLSCRMNWAKDGTSADLSTYAIRQDTFSDATCSASSRTGSGVLLHEKACQGNQRGGMPAGSVRTSCVAKVPIALGYRDQILLQSYADPLCKGRVKPDGSNPEVVSLFLNVCLPYVSKGQHQITTSHRVLTWVRGDGATSDLVLQSALYSGDDKNCRKSPLKREFVVYASKPTGSGSFCPADPLLEDRFYTNAARILLPPSQSSPISWLSSVAFGEKEKTSPPTLQPTPAPSSNPIVTSWLDRLAAAGTGASQQVIAAHEKFFGALSVAGVLSKIVRLNTFAGNDVTAALVPFLKGGGADSDVVYGSSSTVETWAGWYSQSFGLHTDRNQVISTTQLVSQVDFTNANSANSDGTNLHLGLYLVDAPSGNVGGGRSMGVFRHNVYTRHYLLSDGFASTAGLNNGGWGSYFSGSTPLSAGLNLISGSGTSTSATATRYVCPKGSTSSCTTSSITGLDKSQPAQWPVGVFGCFGSSTGVKTESLAAFALLNGRDTRNSLGASGGYTIGYALTSADVVAIRNAFDQLQIDRITTYKGYKWAGGNLGETCTSACPRIYPGTSCAAAGLSATPSEMVEIMKVMKASTASSVGDVAWPGDSRYQCSTNNNFCGSPSTCDGLDVQNRRGLCSCQ